MLVRKRKRKKDKSLVIFKHMNLFLECPFVLLPGVAERTEFALDYLLQLWLFAYIYMPLRKNMFLPWVACPMGSLSS